MFTMKSLRTSLTLAVITGLVTASAAGLAHGGGKLPDAPSLRPGPTLTLKEAIRLADRKNRSLKAVRVDIESAAAKLKASWAVLLPNLYGNAVYTLHDHADKTELGGRTYETRSQHELSAGLEARMPLIDARRWMMIDAARAERDLGGLSVEETRQELLYAVAEAYYQTATLQRLISVYRSHGDALERHLEAARARYRTGVGDLVDVKRAQTDLVSIRENQIKAAFAMEDARDALALLVASDKPPLPVENPQAIPAPDIGPDREPAKALDGRWDLRVARKTVAVAKKNMTAEWMQFLPTLNASWQYDYALTTPDTPRETERVRWFAGFVLSAPLFDYAFYPEIQGQRAELKQVRLLLDDMEADARREFAQAGRAIVQAEYLALTARVKARLADDTLQLAQANYINGGGTAFDVIDAQRSSRSANVDLETRRFELELARLIYLRATGKDMMSLLSGNGDARESFSR